MPKKKKIKHKQPVQEAQVVEPSQNLNPAPIKKHDVFNTTVKIVSTFSDMLNT
jgi:hypothetical protein